MSNRVTEKQLQAIVDRINRTLGTPMTPYAPYDKELGRAMPNANNYHLSHAYGGVSLHKMSSREGCTGVSDVFSCGHVPKRELADRMYSFLTGLDVAKHGNGQD